MKQNYLKSLLVMLMMCVGMGAWAETAEWTASSGALGKTISSKGSTATGTFKTGTFEWDYTRTLKNLTSGKSDYVAMSGNYLQLGSSNAGETVTFTTSNIPGVITSIAIDCASANHTLAVTVGGTNYTLSPTTVPAWSSNKGGTITASGSSSGKVSVSFDLNTTKNPLYIKSITVTYSVASYTAQFSVNGSIDANNNCTVAEGSSIVFPDVPSSIHDKSFIGWTKNALVGVNNAAPSDLCTSAAMGNSDVTYYAVYGSAVENGHLYRLVENDQDNWEGDYLIVSNDYTYDMDTHYGNQNANTYAKYTKVTYNSSTKTINSDGDTDALVYRATATTNGYSLYCVSDNSYLGITANTTSTGAKLRWNTEYSESECDWTLGASSAQNVGSNTLYIRWNNNSGTERFAAYGSSNQNAVCFFKKETLYSYNKCATTVPEHATITLAAYGELPGMTDLMGLEGLYMATFSCSEDVIIDISNDYNLFAVLPVGVEDGYLTTPVGYTSFAAVSDEDAVCTEGYYVPANTGVLVLSMGTEATYYYVVEDDANELESIDPDGVNMLRPASQAKETDGSYKFYKLAYASSSKDALGFYWGAADGGVFASREGSAYLAVPASAGSVKGFSFADMETAIKNVVSQKAENTKIFDLQGRKVTAAQKGLYIINGKKVVK